MGTRESGHEMDYAFAYCVRCGSSRKRAFEGVACVSAEQVGKVVAISHIVRGNRLLGIAPIPLWADQRGTRMTIQPPDTMSR